MYDRDAPGAGKPEPSSPFVIIGVPVFAGRIPRIFLKGFQKVKIIVKACLHGNVVDGGIGGSEHFFAFVMRRLVR